MDINILKHKELPFSSLRELNSLDETLSQGSNDDGNSLYKDQYLQNIQQHRSDISLCLFNTQPML